MAQINPVKIILKEQPAPLVRIAKIVSGSDEMMRVMQSLGPGKEQCSNYPDFTLNPGLGRFTAECYGDDGALLGAWWIDKNGVLCRQRAPTVSWGIE